MTNIVQLNQATDSFDVEYITNDAGVVIGVSHPAWSFDIVRNQRSRKETAFVCKETSEPFGILDSDQFNTVLLSWLLIDDPSILDLVEG